MARIVILGAGVMGSAMSVPARARGHDVRLVGTHLDEDIVASVVEDRFHPRLDLTLPDGVKAYHWGEFPCVMSSGADLVVVGVSSAGIDWAIDRLEIAMKAPCPVLMITKGMRVAGERLGPLPDHVATELEARLGFHVPVIAVAGPAIAGEQAAGRATSVVFTGSKPEAVDAVMVMLRAPNYHLRGSSDVVGVEICAAFKNFFALGVGTAAGRLEAAGAAPNGARAFNEAAGLFTQALSELGHLVAAHGGSPETVAGLAGTGDLYVTCMAGRNSRMGRLLGLGLNYSEAKAKHMPHDTVEGAELALATGPALRAMMADGRLDGARLPMTRAILDAICDNRPFRTDWPQYYPDRHNPVH